MPGTKSKQQELGYFMKKLLSHSERTVCECVVEHRSNHSDNTEGKETWLRIASEHRLSEYGELGKI